MWSGGCPSVPLPGSEGFFGGTGGVPGAEAGAGFLTFRAVNAGGDRLRLLRGRQLVGRHAARLTERAVAVGASAAGNARVLSV